MNLNWSEATAPSNIALIKYMGKLEDPTANRSANASLSWTLDHLKTRVRVKWEDGHAVKHLWRPWTDSHSKNWHSPILSVAGKERYLRHADRCLARINEHQGASLRLKSGSSTNGTLIVESANGFPSDCGLASSASSFAALTLAIAKLLDFDTEKTENRIWLAGLSREGSGSSCRSLFSPWSIWNHEGASAVEGLPSRKNIRHIAIIVDEQKKSVSSSEAHVRVTTSALFKGRIERAEERLRILLDCLKRSGSATDGVSAWNRAANTVWAESWDMHALFETSNPPFGYFVPETVTVLNMLREVSEHSMKAGNRMPIVTMDAGPNVHALFWSDEASDQAIETLKLRFVTHSSIRILDSKEMEAL